MGLMEPPNGLGFSGGALIDREGSRADSNFQNGRDLVGAKRRPLQARVGRVAGFRHSDAIGYSGVIDTTVPRFVEGHRIARFESHPPLVVFTARRVSYQTKQCAKALDLKWSHHDPTIFYLAKFAQSLLKHLLGVLLVEVFSRTKIIDTSLDQPTLSIKEKEGDKLTTQGLVVKRRNKWCR